MKVVVSLTVVAVLSAMSLAEEPPVTQVVKNGMGAVHFLRYSPNGKELVRICQFGGVEIFDVQGYDKIRTFDIGMRMVAFSADGTRIATAEGTDGARVWDAAQPGKPFPEVLPKDGPYKQVLVLDVPLKVLEKPYVGEKHARDVQEKVYWAEFSPDGKRVATAQANGHVKVWDTAAWTVEEDLVLTKTQACTVAFAPDGTTLVYGGSDGTLHEWSFEKKAEIRTAKADGAVTSISFAPDGKTLVTVHQYSSVGYRAVVWDADRKALETKEGWASAAFSKDGKTLALGGKHVELFDAVTRKSIRVIELPEMTMDEAAPEMSKDGTAADAETPFPMLVGALAFAPDGTTLAAGCQDGTIRLVKYAAERSF
jgi:WD40 repeat protein